MDEQLLTLSQLLGDARRPAAGAAAFGRTSHASTSALPSLASPGPPRLHPGLARELRELSALDSAFTRWQAGEGMAGEAGASEEACGLSAAHANVSQPPCGATEAEAFQRAAARDFADDQAFSLVGAGARRWAGEWVLDRGRRRWPACCGWQPHCGDPPSQRQPTSMMPGF